MFSVSVLTLTEKSAEMSSSSCLQSRVPINYLGSWPYGPAPTPSAGFLSAFLVPHVLKEKLNSENTLAAASFGLIPWAPQECAWELNLSVKDVFGAPGGTVSGSDSASPVEIVNSNTLWSLLWSALVPSWKPSEFTQHFCSVQKCCREVSWVWLLIIDFFKCSLLCDFSQRLKSFVM